MHTLSSILMMEHPDAADSAGWMCVFCFAAFPRRESIAAHIIARMSWDAYTEAVVRVYLPDGVIVVRPGGAIGMPTGRFPDAVGRTIHIITAHNPQGTLSSALDNDSAHDRLLEAVRVLGLAVWDAVGGDPTWTHTEASVSLVGLNDDDARELGAAYGQEAIFAWRPDAWLVLSCHDSMAKMSGWIAEEIPLTPGGTPEPIVPDLAQPDNDHDSQLTRTSASSRVRVAHPPAQNTVVVTNDRPDPVDDGETRGSVLADIYWDLGPGGGGSPGNDDSGRVVLLRHRT